MKMIMRSYKNDKNGGDEWVKEMIWIEWRMILKWMKEEMIDWMNDFKRAD